MTQQTRSPISFATYLINTKQELHHVLDAVTKKIDWAPFEKMLSKVYDKPVGRKSYPALMMFKCLLLQNWYNLSDFRA